MPLLVGMSYGALLKRFSVMRQLFITKDLLHTRCHHDAKARVNASKQMTASTTISVTSRWWGMGYRGDGALRESFPVYRQP